MPSDRDAILERRALFLASALATLGCAPTPLGSDATAPSRRAGPPDGAPGMQAMDASADVALPLDARQVVLSVCLSIVVPPNIEFAWGSDEPNAESDKTIDAVADILRDNPEVCLEIEGHADSNEPDRKALSERRARSVEKQLHERGIAPGRLTTVGLADQQPRVPMGSKSGKNRRIELRAKRGAECPQ